MKNRLGLWAAFSASVISTSVIFIVEFAFSNGFPVGIPWAVFGFLLLSSYIAIYSLFEGVKLLKKKKVMGLSGILAGALALSAWSTLFLDQLPCFLGGLGC